MAGLPSAEQVLGYGVLVRSLRCGRGGPDICQVAPKDGAYKVNGSHRLPAPKAEGG